MADGEQSPGQPVEPTTAAILEAYKRLLTYQFGGALLFVVILGLALVFARLISRPPPVMLLIMLCGMLGAFFSALMRLYSVDSAAAAVISPTMSKLGALHLLIYSLVPPIIGAIAALVLYLGFAGDILQGAVFPKIACSQGTCNTIYEMIIYFVPSTPVDYARALLWSFIAGFSERFVPDTLLTLVTKQREQQ